jgi:peptidoglycan hydrolase-like protein with peptidoglycan-binding domain
LHKAFIIVPIVGWAGIAALVHYAQLSFPKAEEGTVVVVSPRAGDAAGRTALPEPPRTAPTPGNRTALVRELQKELIRVGCYDGEISGVWTTSSRRAMRDFTDRVNAKLPIDEPDQILLSLVQGHRQKACGAACPAGQEAAAGGRCVPTALTSRPAKPPTYGTADAPAERSGIITGSTTTAAALAAAAAASMPPSARGPAETAAPVKSTAAPPVGENEGLRTAAKSGPVPPAGVTDEQSRRQTRRVKSKPPAVVRSLIRSVKSALNSVGIR